MENELVSLFDDFFGKNNRLVGFDDYFKDLTVDYKSTTFPPYNIYKDNVTVTVNGEEVPEEHTFIDVATAGFKKNELSVSFDERRHTVEIAGEKINKDVYKYSYRGIANRNFSLKWKMQPNLEFVKCSYNDGILHVEFKAHIDEEQPEVKKLPID